MAFIIHQAPDISMIMRSEEKMGILFAKSRSNSEFQKAVQKANAHYLHWNEVRHIPIPHEFSHEEVWTYIKILRQFDRKPACFKDKNGNIFAYQIPDSIHKILSEIDQWLSGAFVTDQPGALASRERYVISSLMDEAIASSQLEGAATTRQIAKEMLRTGRPPQDTSERMILNNWEAMQYIRRNKDKKLSIETLCEVHSIITAETLKNQEESGRLRTKDDIVVHYREQVVHIPPKANTLPERVKAFCEFFNREEAEGNWIHPVIKGIMLHFWLAYDHPFSDGNGRTARALMYWYVLSKGYYLFEFLPISRYYVRAPAKYVRAYLRTETDEGDLTYFFNYNLKAIQKAIQDLRVYLVRKQHELVRSSELLRNYRGLNARQKALIYYAIRNPDTIFSIQSHKRSHGIAYETARNDLMRLTAKQFLRKKKQGREFVFVSSDRMLEKLRINESRLPRVM